MPQAKVDKLISLRFALNGNNEALAKLQASDWVERSKMIAEWYKCWLEEQKRSCQRVVGDNNDYS